MNASDKGPSREQPDAPSGEMGYNATLVRDLTNHAWSKIGPALYDVMGLADNPETAFEVAFMLLGQVAGACGGATAALCGYDESPEEKKRATLAVIDIVRQIFAEGLMQFSRVEQKPLGTARYAIDHLR